MLQAKVSFVEILFTIMNKLNKLGWIIHLSSMTALAVHFRIGRNQLIETFDGEFDSDEIGI